MEDNELKELVEAADNWRGLCEEKYVLMIVANAKTSEVGTMFAGYDIEIMARVIQSYMRRNADFTECIRMAVGLQKYNSTDAEDKQQSVKFHGIEIVPGMSLKLKNVDHNGMETLETGVVFPTKRGLAVILYRKMQWDYLSDIKEANVVAIYDITDITLTDRDARLWPKRNQFRRSEIAERLGISEEVLEIID